jgi:hypothetical protein
MTSARAIAQGDRGRVSELRATTPERAQPVCGLATRALDDGALG